MLMGLCEFFSQKLCHSELTPKRETPPFRLAKSSYSDIFFKVIPTKQLPTQDQLRINKFLFTFSVT